MSKNEMDLYHESNGELINVSAAVRKMVDKIDACVWRLTDAQKAAFWVSRQIERSLKDFPNE